MKIRQAVSYIYACTAPEIVFGEDWDAIPEEHIKIIEKSKGLRCDGGGWPGPWCERCYYGAAVEPDEVYMEDWISSAKRCMGEVMRELLLEREEEE